MPSTTPETATRHIGFCAYCERDIKLDLRGRLVHHGYTRPGDGSILGDCPLVGEVPYETSCVPLGVHVASAKHALARVRLRLGHLRSGEVHYLERHERVGRRRGEGFKFEVLTFCRFVTEHWLWVRELGRAIAADELSEGQWARELARLDGWVSRWEKKPVRTVEEEIRKAEASRKERQAALATLRAERAEKERLRQEKQNALKARREEIKKRFTDDAELLAKRVTVEGAGALGKEIEKIAAALRREKWLWIHDVPNAHSALVVLGLGEFKTVGIQDSQRFIPSWRIQRIWK